MSVLSCVLAGLVLLLCPYLIRVPIMALPQKLNQSKSCSYLTAVLVFFSITEGLFLLTQLLGKGLSAYRLGLCALALVCALSAILVLLIDKPVAGKLKEEVIGFLKSVKEAKLQWLIVSICFLICLFVVFFVQRPLASDMYDTAERTQMIVKSGGFFGIDPLTGQLSAGISAKERLMGLPALYAAVCSLLPIPVLLFLTRVIPICLLVYVFSLFSQITKSVEKIAYAPLCFTFLLALLCAGNAYRNPFYDLLYLPFEGRTYVAVFLLPAGAVLLWKCKKWWQYIGIVVLVLTASLFFAGAAEGCLIAGLCLVLWSVVIWISRFIS